MELAIPFLDLFREEFFVALGRSLDWTDRDAEEFWRDLELYEQLTEHAPGRPAFRTSRSRRFRTVRRSRRDAARSVPDGTSSPRRRQISD